MKPYLEKNLRIINELVTYCHWLGAEKYDIHFNHEADHCTIEISCAIASVDPDDLQELEDVLNLPRQREIEQNYWELSGDSELEGELTLVGMMVDKATVTYSGGVLHISALRIE